MDVVNAAQMNRAGADQHKQFPVVAQCTCGGRRSREGNRKAATELGNGEAIELHRCHLGVKLEERRRDGAKPGAQLYDT